LQMLKMIEGTPWPSTAGVGNVGLRAGTSDGDAAAIVQDRGAHTQCAGL
jgi:hypothetical protein